MTDKPSSGNPVVLQVEPQLDLAATQRLQARLRELAAVAPSLRLDMAEVKILPSSAIGVLIEAHNELLERGLSLELDNVRPELARLFRIMGLDRHFVIREAGK